MNISSTPFIRNDYWPDYNDINELNKRIDETENEISLVNIRLSADIENVSNNLNSYINNQANTIIANNIIVNNLNANYATGKFANFTNTNTDNAYIENLTVNKPVFDITLNTPHIENTTSLGGNFYNTNLIDPKFSGDASGDFNTVNVNVINANTANISNLFVNTQPEPVTSSAVLGYDSEGRVIPVHATYDASFPENANYLFTDSHGTAFAGIAATEVDTSSNLITAYAVKNAIDNVTADVSDNFNTINNALNDVDSWMNNIENDVSNSFNDVANNFNDVANNFNEVANNFNDVANNFNEVANNFNDVANNFSNVANNFNNVNNTTNNLLDNVDYLKTALAPLLNLAPANVSGWINSNSPVNIQGIRSFVVAPFAASGTTGSSVGGGAKLNVSGTTATLALPNLQWTKESMFTAFTYCRVFNQNIQIPDGTTNMNQAFYGCFNFNQNIQIPDSVTDMSSCFSGSYDFNQNILIPNSVTNLISTFGGDVPVNPDDPDSETIGCPNFNRNILIPNSVTNMAYAFCNDANLNQPDMYIYSQNISSMFYTFYRCHINNIHIPTSVPKSTSNRMYNSLVNGITGITFPATNIFNDLPVDIAQWPPV